MPAKYSHAKKRTASGLKRKSNHSPAQTLNSVAVDDRFGHVYGHRHSYGNGNGHGTNYKSNPLVDKSISQAMTAVAHLEPAISELERSIARILLIRYEHDIARLFSTRIYTLSLVQLPTFVMRCLSLGGPSWLAWNCNSEEIKDFFRAVLAMDMRQAGERVATKSVLWSYTALRQFALSNNISICSKRGLHSLRLLPHYPAIKAHLDTLEALPLPTFAKPPHLGSLQEGQSALEDACELKYGRINDMPAHPDWNESSNWKEKVQYGYEKTVQTLWRVAREFDVRGYGLVLREKLTTKWCDCGCSTDHLGEVCERTVREDEEESGVRLGKQKEWDGRGSGIYGWETEEEEDIWEVDLNFGGMEQGLDPATGATRFKETETSIGEMMEWRYLCAEKEKEKGNTAFRKGNFEDAIKYYEAAYRIDPEIPHYQLNLAAAHLKLTNWLEAEKACTKALGQHHSTKGLYRRARARRMLGREDDAVRDLRAALKIQPSNTEALHELMSLIPLVSDSEGKSRKGAAIRPEEVKTPPPKKKVTKIPSPSNIPSSSSFPSPSSLSTTSSPSASSSSSRSDTTINNSPTNSSSSSCSPSSSSTSSSSSFQQYQQELFSRLGIPKIKNSKDPPFSRVSNDSRRLKIVLLPTSNAPFSPVPPPPFNLESMASILEGLGGVGVGKELGDEFTLLASSASSSCNSEQYGFTGGGRGMGSIEKDGKKNGKGKGKGKKSERVKEIEKMKAEGMSYPSWDRYVVKLI
ncbi:hypothetical protein Agabi119p4_5288 [Agaricus bisporus var. burnettii]|uniref:RNA-polymerase II-associated protein 3-like C-terminal domain-containing protein n=1 Tax=Agaricus bisporus var. burnettii TaxID=192524 RepID=A0A8H7F1E1_AGABI|nr:hypothetical protein Agabi119p4_5288 [Agaricus bisporus var. burnettii]